MSVDPELLRLQESVPCVGCPLAMIRKAHDKKFANRDALLEVESQFAGVGNPLDFIEPGYDIHTGGEITEDALKAMRRGGSDQLPGSDIKNITRHKFLQKKLMPRDIGAAYELLNDKSAEVYTFGCTKPYKRFKLFGKVGCGGLVLGEAAAVKRYELRARQLNELASNS